MNQQPNQFPNQPGNPQAGQQVNNFANPQAGQQVNNFANPQAGQQMNNFANPQAGQWSNSQMNAAPIPPYMPTSDPVKKKQLNMISVIIGIVCTLMIVFATNNVINGSIFNIPILQLAGSELDELEDEIDEYLDELDELSDDEIDELEDKSGMTIKEVEKYLKSPSISVTGKIMKIAGDDMDDDALAVFAGIQVFVIAYGGLIALLMLLGAVLKNRALSIVSTVISFLFHLALSGIFFFILQVAFCVAHVVVLTKAKKA